MKNVKTKNIYKSGFTIIELLIVIVVIGILSTLAVLGFSGAFNKAKETSVNANLTNCVKSLEMYHVEHNLYPTTTDYNDSPPDSCKSGFFEGANYQYVSDTGANYKLTGALSWVELERNSNSTVAVEPGGVATNNSDPNPPTVVPNDAYKADVLVVAGGGGGGSDEGGGGGAGGVNIVYSLALLNDTSYPVTVGGGGIHDSRGSDSRFGNVIATGGGAGGKYLALNDKNGGSGGGSSGAGTAANNPNGGGTAVSGQGNGGGMGGRYGGGGGGGAGGPGYNASGSTRYCIVFVCYDGLRDIGGMGGIGTISAISGISAIYAGGGGGGGSTAGIGQYGGGKGAARGSFANAGNGLANTGSGGGGHGHTSGYYGGSGGSGIVVISYHTKWISANNCELRGYTDAENLNFTTVGPIEDGHTICTFSTVGNNSTTISYINN